MNRIEVSTGHGSEIYVVSDVRHYNLNPAYCAIIGEHSFYKIKIKFAGYYIVTKILRTDTYIYFIISDWIIT